MKYGHKEYHVWFSPYTVLSVVKESRLRCAGNIIRMKLCVQPLQIGKLEDRYEY
jgi:hypothetical protein